MMMMMMMINTFIDPDMEGAKRHVSNYVNCSTFDSYRELKAGV